MARQSVEIPCRRVAIGDLMGKKGKPMFKKRTRLSSRGHRHLDDFEMVLLI